MRELVVDSFIWWTGALVWVVLALALTGALAGLLYYASTLAGRSLLKFVRFRTAFYWVERMEREGLTFPQTQYRQWVAERKPKTLEEFYELDAKVEAIEQEQERAQEQANEQARSE